MTQQAASKKLRVATAWLGGCSGCHMSLLDLDEKLIDLLSRVELVYSPLADIKIFPEGVDVCLVEGAVTNIENLELVRQIRARSRMVIAFGDCAVTGNVTSMRNLIPVEDLLTAVYKQATAPVGVEALKILPGLLNKAVPLHQTIRVDLFLPGYPPAPERIEAVLEAVLDGRPVDLTAAMRTFG